MTRAEKISQKENLTEGPLFLRLLFFTLPLIATSVLQLLFNTADIVVVGRWGGDTPLESAHSLAAVGSCSTLIALLVNLFFGISAGVGVCVANDIGAGKIERIEKTIQTSIITALISGGLVTAVGILFCRPMLQAMGTDISVLDEAAVYMCAYLVGMPANMLYNFCSSILRAKGDTVRPLLFLSVAGVVNVLFNLLTVIVFRWGALGVGVATAASQWVSCVLIVFYMMKMDGVCRLDMRKLGVDSECLRRILYQGLPAGFQSLLFSVSNVLVQAAVNSFGPIVVAGNTAAGNLDGYIWVSQNSLYHAALTFVSQHMGAQKFQRMKKVIGYCAILVTAVGLTLGSVMFLFREPLLRIYAPDNTAVVEAGMVRLKVMCTTYFLCGLMEVGSGTLRGLGKSISSMLISMFGACAVRLFWIYTVFYAVVGMGVAQEQSLTVLFLSYPVAWILTILILFSFAGVYLHKLITMQKKGYL